MPDTYTLGNIDSQSSTTTLPGAPDSVVNPTGDTAGTFIRDQKIANALEQMSRVQCLSATPYTVKQALIHAFAEGGWRHGFRLMPERFQRDSKGAQSTAVHLLTSNGRKLKLTVEYEDS